MKGLLEFVTLGYLLSGTQFTRAETVKCSGDVWPVREFRAVWVATVKDMDWPLSRYHSSSQQKAELVLLLDKLQKLNFNAIVFQVRSAGDAMYNSTLEPWSEYLTGSQGRAPSPYYDPLAFLLEEAHRRNMEVHSWYNPYLARSGSTSKAGLAPNHMAVKYPRYAYAYGNSLWMDPGAKVVQDQCYNVIMDVVKRYDIDGVHMDDYFYPYPVSGQSFPDNATYNAYRKGGGHLGRDDWRRDNVNSLIQRLYNGTKATKKHVKFGLSPFGIWKSGIPKGIVGLSSYYEQYADSRKWFDEGWVDYFTPQLYWRIDPVKQSFTHLMDWWLQQNSKHRHFYAGSYAGNVVEQNWPLDEIKRQVEEARKRRDKLSLGDVFFSAKYFRDNSKGLSTMFQKDLYTVPALAPPMPWLGANPPPPPSGVRVSGSTLTWNKDGSGVTRSWAVYRYEADAWELKKLLNNDTTSWSVPSGRYAITAVDRLSNESGAVVKEVQGGANIID
ncbi:glycosyl hydrolase YngK-like [Haliotis rubra]|uniref:glycosyl hydrolase YngK-like n=1 Tax=Haliotis rubra TaxID=36100 RepID=UPI001EE56D82|nr:glycosyl hydrolase YngK-like [Haliotis rubra]